MTDSNEVFYELKEAIEILENALQEKFSVDGDMLLTPTETRNYVLKWGKHNKQWGLWVYSGDGSDIHRLKDANVNVRIEAANQIAQLVKQLRITQATTNSQLRTATKTYLRIALAESTE